MQVAHNVNLRNIADSTPKHWNKGLKKLVRVSNFRLGVINVTPPPLFWDGGSNLTPLIRGAERMLLLNLI